MNAMCIVWHGTSEERRGVFELYSLRLTGRTINMDESLLYRRRCIASFLLSCRFESSGIVVVDVNAYIYRRV